MSKSECVMCLGQWRKGNRGWLPSANFTIFFRWLSVQIVLSQRRICRGALLTHELSQRVIADEPAGKAAIKLVTSGTMAALALSSGHMPLERRRIPAAVADRGTYQIFRRARRERSAALLCLF